jgi:ATP-dependent Clp protease ATP-binding subunit ClpC
VFERFTDASRQAVVLAQQWAVEHRHRSITTAHLLVGVARARGGVAALALSDVGITPERLERSVLAVHPEGRSAPASQRVPFTPAAKKTMELALREALRLDDSAIDTGHLLLALLEHPGDDLDAVFADAEVDAVPVRRATERRLAERPGEGLPRAAQQQVDRMARIEALLTDAVTRLERIERRLDRS